MTPERFRALTEAYGAAASHWPQAERAAALALIERQDPEALAALAQARQLDQLLASYTVAAPTPALTLHVAASAQPALNGIWIKRWISGIPQGGILRGLGLVGAGLAGIATGVVVVSLLTQAVAVPGLTELSYSSTAFGGATQNWSNE